MRRYLLQIMGVGFASAFAFSVASFCMAMQESGHRSGNEYELNNTITFDKHEVFDEVAAIVEKHFFDEEVINTVWKPKLRNARERAIAANTHDEFAEAINDILGELNTSHTYYFSKLHPKRYQILGVFSQLYDPGDQTLFVYDGIGIDTKTVEGKVIISSVFNGFPAKLAGLRFGDQIISVNGEPFHPILSFAGHAGSTVVVEIARGTKRMSVRVEPTKLDGRTMFVQALEESIRVIEKGERKIGYLHTWSYAGRKYHDIVENALLWGKLSQCDGLILDLRDGWGGASPSYLNLFRKPIFETESISRSEPPRTYTGVWGKPVVLLTNRGSTSGKELFSYGFKKLGLGRVVGDSSAGAVVAGRAFLLSNKDFLYLAVSDIKVDGQRLEGQGVPPDVRVLRDLENGHQYGDSDPQVEAATEQLLKQINN